MLDKKKLTKEIWYDDMLWEVKDIFPTNYVTYLLLESEYDDGDAVMTLIEAENARFYPNTKKIKTKMAKIKEAEKQYSEKVSKARDGLTDEWLEMFEGTF